MMISGFARRLMTIAALGVLIGAGTAAARIYLPKVTGFEVLHYKPDCLALGASSESFSKAEVSEEGSPAIQTLWIENTCGHDVTFDRMENTFPMFRTPEMIHKMVRVVFASRQQDLRLIKTPSYTFRLDAAATNACSVADIVAHPPDADKAEPDAIVCKSITFAPRTSIGFTPFPPLDMDWQGPDGVFLRGITQQSP